MKVFWSIVAVLLIAAVAAAFMPDDRSGSLAAANSSDTPSPQAEDTQPQDRDVASPMTDEPNSTTDPNGPTDTIFDDSLVANREVDHADSADPANPDSAAAPNGDTLEPADSTNESTSTELATSNEDAAADAAASLLDATIEEQPDGSLLIAGKYTVSGSGETGDPYVIPWDLLVSTSAVYQPREGLDQIPDYIMQMHDKQVEITGYVAFPMVAGEIEELLIMLNQWDGCCIGVPPTVYDSVEVRLIDALVTNGASATSGYGTVVGRMTIDPYFVNDWLVGLYLMEDAEINLDL